MSIKQVLLVLSHNYCSRFLETTITVTQLFLVVALFPRLEKAVSLLGGCPAGHRQGGARQGRSSPVPGSAGGAAGGRRGREEPGAVSWAGSSAGSGAVGEGAAAGDAPPRFTADVREGERPLPRQPRTMAAPGRCCRPGSRGEAAGLVLVRPVVLGRAGALRAPRPAERGGACPLPPRGGAAARLCATRGSALPVHGTLFRAAVAPLLVAGLRRFPPALVWSSGQLLAELSSVLSALRLGRSAGSEGGCSVE